MEGRFIVRLESRNSERFAQLALSMGSFFISLHTSREGSFHGHLDEPGDHGPRKVPIDPPARRGIEDHGHPMGRAFYCFMASKRVTVLHAFIKKTQQTPD